METSRSVPQQTAQIFSPLAGQNLAAFRFSQPGHVTESPCSSQPVKQNTPWERETQNMSHSAMHRIRVSANTNWMFRAGASGEINDENPCGNRAGDASSSRSGFSSLISPE